MKKLKHLFLAIFSLITVSSHAQVSAAYSARLQFVLDSVCDKYHVKGASSAVYVPNQGIWKGVHGISSVGNPITTDMLLGLGSNTKTYIAALMLKLQENGLVNLSDTIGTWIHNQPNISGQITIRQLLNHTSGIFNYTDTSAFGDSLNVNYTRIWHASEMLQFVGKPLFAPGTGWSYSNTNYLLAGMIIAQVTGLNIEQALRNYILNPQALSSTWFYPLEIPTTGIIAQPWFLYRGTMIDGTTIGYTNEAFFSAANAAGCLLSTAEDNVMFWHKMISGQILSTTSMNLWRQTVPLNKPNIGYGLGVFRYRYFDGHVVYEHGGTGVGFINENLADSVTGICISVLTNQDSADNDVLLYQVVSALHRVTNNPPTAIRELSNTLNISMYPNPAHSTLQVLLNNNIGNDLCYTIVNTVGNNILNGKLQAGNNTINVGNINSGLYFLHVYNNSGANVVRQFNIIR